MINLFSFHYVGLTLHVLRTHLTNLWTHYWNLLSLGFAIIWILIIQSGQNIAHGTTHQLSYSDMCNIVAWLDYYFYCKSIRYLLHDLDNQLINTLWNGSPGKVDRWVCILLSSVIRYTMWWNYNMGNFLQNISHTFSPLMVRYGVYLALSDYMGSVK